MLNIPDFYPTPTKLISKLLAGIDFNIVTTFLEPESGQGHICDVLVEKFKLYHPYYHGRDFKWQDYFDLDTIEIEENFSHILKGKGYRVIHDDFLTFETFKRYQAIIMNPPFSAGDKHLLKALDLMTRGGIIRCLLNAETIKNPYTNTRKDLVRRLDELDAEIEFIKDSFIDAERKTGVEVALIKAAIPEAKRDSVIFQGLKQEEWHEKTVDNAQSITDGDPIKAIVERYNFEVKLGLHLIDEYEILTPHFQRSFKNNLGAIFELKINGEREQITRNKYIQMVRAKYWETLFLSDVFMNHFTCKLRNEYIGRIRELQDYDFSLYNIYSIKAEVIKLTSKSIEDTILALFDEFSNKHHWYDEMSKNIHYYNGWKTNKSWCINKKVIIPLNAFDNWRNTYTLYLKSRTADKLADIEKIFDYLDGGRSNHVDLYATLQKAQEAGQTSKIPLKYFNVTVYKKGTCHIEFTNLELLKKFNLFGSQRKGWLPPGYGKVKYEDMSQEEKAVIDDFEGEVEYRKVMKNKDYYLCESVGLLVLEQKGA